MNEFIEKLIGRLEEYKKQWLDADYLDGIDEIIEIVNELAEEQKGGWIPCSERLPNLFDTVIVTTKDGATWFGHWDGQCFEDDGTEYFHTLKVIAWQPLPDPYKKEGAE